MGKGGLTNLLLEDIEEKENEQKGKQNIQSDVDGFYCSNMSNQTSFIITIFFKNLYSTFHKTVSGYILKIYRPPQLL